MGKTQQALDEHPEELRKKLALLEGDKKAYFESSQTVIEKNKQAINDLRKENKAMAAKLKSLKTGSGSTQANQAVDGLDYKISDLKKKVSAAKHQNATKQKTVQDLEKDLDRIGVEESGIKRTQGGQSEEAQKLRELENRLDKATIKFEEAQRIGTTYSQIISVLEQERLGFDGKIAEFQKTIAARKQNIVDLEAMCSDATLARDSARKELSRLEKEFEAARAAREAEKRQLNAVAEERRRQYEAIEKRLRLVSMGNQQSNAEHEIPEETRMKAITYEDAMRQIKEATGILDINEVLRRFQSQGETQKHLETLQKENTVRLNALKEEYATFLKQLDSIKYSGDAKNSSGARMIAEFDAHLKDVQTRYDTAVAKDQKSAKMLVGVKAGIDHLYEKLATLSSNDSNTTSVSDPKEKLAHIETKLTALLQEVDSHKAEIDADLPPLMVLPEHNTRINLAETISSTKDDDYSSGDEVITRDSIKKTAQSLVDSKTTKPKKTTRRRKKVSS